jgi:hypothetical protein
MRLTFLAIEFVTPATNEVIRDGRRTVDVDEARTIKADFAFAGSQVNDPGIAIGKVIATNRDNAGARLKRQIACDV